MKKTVLYLIMFTLLISARTSIADDVKTEIKDIRSVGGNLIGQEVYENNQLVKSMEFYRQGEQNDDEANFAFCQRSSEMAFGGEIKAEYFYKNNKKDGLARIYYKTGNVAKEIPYEQDKINGEARTYYPSGFIKYKQHYKNGQYVSGEQFEDNVSFYGKGICYGDRNEFAYVKNGKIVAAHFRDSPISRYRAFPIKQKGPQAIDENGKPVLDKNFIAFMENKNGVYQVIDELGRRLMEITFENNKATKAYLFCNPSTGEDIQSIQIEWSSAQLHNYNMVGIYPMCPAFRAGRGDIIMKPEYKKVQTNWSIK